MSFLPVADRELRVASRRKSTYWTRVAAAGVGVATFFWIWLGEIIQQIPSTGGRPFELLTQFAFVFCLLAGVVFSADSLSNERKDGTLGLLFLTDLEGYDVVLGKLVSTSFRAIYGFAALAPILALPIILGGVTRGQFARMILALSLILFLSISVSLLVSSLYRKSTTAQVVTAIALLVFTALHSGPARSASPWQLYLLAFDSGYQLNPPLFWLTGATIAVIAMCVLAAACWVLPRTWRDRTGGVQSNPVTQWLFGKPILSAAGRSKDREILEANPFSWLVHWGCLPRIWLWLSILAAALALLSMAQIDRQLWGPGVVAVLATGSLHLILKVWMAFEASKRFSEDRQNGTLELVLGTGIQVKNILAGYRSALRRRLIGPLIAVLVLDLILAGVVVAGSVGMRPTILGIIATFALMLIDLYTLSWVGMWMGITTRKPSRAALATIWRVVVVPVILFVGLLLVAGVQMAGSLELILAWFSIGVLNNFFLWTLAFRGTHEEFRKVAHWHVEGSVEGVENALSTEDPARHDEFLASSSSTAHS